MSAVEHPVNDVLLPHRNIQEKSWGYPTPERLKSRFSLRYCLFGENTEDVATALKFRQNFYNSWL